MKPHTKLRNVLVHPKDQRSIDENTGVVYRIPCGGCDKSYIGETQEIWDQEEGTPTEVEAVGSSYFTRGKRKESTSHMHKSAISDHVASENHHIDWKKCSILARDSGKPSRWIREAIHIRKEQGKTLNRDLDSTHYLQYTIHSLGLSTNAIYVGYSGRTSFPQYIDLTKPTELTVGERLIKR